MYYVEWWNFDTNVTVLLLLSYVWCCYLCLLLWNLGVLLLGVLWRHDGFWNGTGGLVSMVWNGLTFFTWSFSTKDNVIGHTLLISIYNRCVIPMFTPFKLQDNSTFRSPPSKKCIWKQFTQDHKVSSIIQNAHLSFKLPLVFCIRLVRQGWIGNLLATESHLWLHCTNSTLIINPFTFKVSLTFGQPLGQADLQSAVTPPGRGI